MMVGRRVVSAAAAALSPAAAWCTGSDKIGKDDGVSIIEDDSELVWDPSLLVVGGSLLGDGVGRGGGISLNAVVHQ